MSKTEDFRAHIEEGYTFKNDYIVLGTSVLDGEPLNNNLIKVPLKTLNRHGLIAGATGTGKTKTLQNLAERLSEKSIPVLLMDLKGDLSGLTQASSGHPKIDERHEHIGVPWKAQAYPCELMTISEQEGVRMRATISEFGPVLLSKILDLNETQAGAISVVFKYCDDNGLPLLDIKDLRIVLQYISDEAKDEVEKEYGYMAATSIGAIMRKLLEIEEQGADLFFGERSFDVKDLMRVNEEGMGYINILRLTDIQSKPKLFSTFMLCLLAEIYGSLEVQGDKDSPELVIFIDEAHLIFKEASKALLEQLEMIVKLIRSKGAGLFFVTQNPTDVPDAVLSQLGMKVQHALRAFTAKDRKAIKQTAENYPLSDYYNTDQTLTELGIGEAFVTVLNEKGIPTPLAHTLLTAPSSRMDVIYESEKKELLKKSNLLDKYAEEIDRESAYEMLNKRIEKLAKIEDTSPEKKKGSKAKTRNAKGSSVLDKIKKFSNSYAGKRIIHVLERGLFMVLGAIIGYKSKTKK
jgi:DNA helicase HerA-like ATPase